PSAASRPGARTAAVATRLAPAPDPLRVRRRDRLGGLVHEYSVAAWTRAGLRTPHPFGVRAAQVGERRAGRRWPTRDGLAIAPGRTHARTPTRSLRAAPARSSDDPAARTPCPPRSPP